MTVSDDGGARESLVAAALFALDEDDQDRALAAVRAVIDQLKQALDAQRRGVRVSPYWRQSVAEIFAAEAERRSTGWDLDPSAPVFRAWSEARALAEQVKEMDPDDEG